MALKLLQYRESLSPLIETTAYNIFRFSWLDDIRRDIPGIAKYRLVFILTQVQLFTQRLLSIT